MDALQHFSKSYSLEKNTVTYCKYFVLAVHMHIARYDIGMYYVQIT